jgi:hypothetical protein
MQGLLSLYESDQPVAQGRCDKARRAEHVKYLKKAMANR